MSRIRVLDLAKELGMETKTAIIKLQELGIQVKNHFNAVSETEAARLRAFHRSGKNPEKEAAQKASSKLIIRRKVEISPEELPPETSLSFSSLHEAQKMSSEDIHKQKFSESHEDTPNSSGKKETTSTAFQKNLETEKIKSSNLNLSKNHSSQESKNLSTNPEQRETKAASHQAQESSVGNIQETHIESSQAKYTDTAASALRFQESEENKIVQTHHNSENAHHTAPSHLRANIPSNTSHPGLSTHAHSRNHPSVSPKGEPSPMGAIIVRKAETTPTPQKPSGIKQQGTGYTTASFHTSSSNAYRRDDSRSGGHKDPSFRSPSIGGSNTASRDRFAGHHNRFETQNRHGSPYSSGTQSTNGNSRFNQNSGTNFTRDPASGSSGQGGYRTAGSGGHSPTHQGFGEKQNFSASRSGSGPASSNNRLFSMGNDVVSSTTSTKDVPSRLKDREKDKDREKRKINEEEDARKLRARQRRIEEVDEDFDIYTDFDDSEGGEQVSTVRTMIPNRKKSLHTYKKKEARKTEKPNPTKASKKIIRVDEYITVNDLAGELSQKANAVIKTLMKLGMMATVNQQLDLDMATFVAQEFGYEIQNSAVSIGDILSRKTTKHEDITLTSRPPIVTIMGHVDHGKTSLLDAIRSANVASKEAGGITQHIGAYQIDYKGKKITFLDTPGHEAFTAMRARGAQLTDIVVLVVAADDGVMPQTIEAIAHAKAAKVPIVVAVNKIDKPGANLERIHRELSEHGVLPEEWGGDSLFIPVSAKTHQGLNELIEAILLQSEILDLKAAQDCLAEGIVIEAKLDKSKGPVATVIVTKGSLKPQDYVVVGTSMGRLRAMHDDQGHKIAIATPSFPVEIIGLGNVPASGDQFNCVVSDSIAKEAVAYRVEKQRQKDLSSQRNASLEDLLAIMSNSENKAKEISVIVKTDTHGSGEAIRVSLQKLETPKVKAKILHTAVGGITETDIILAKASQALILGFNVRPDRVAAQFAEQSGIKIEYFSIIYELIEAVRAAMLGTLAPIKMDKIMGHAEVRTIFAVPKIGVIAGSMISDGKILRNSNVRIIRNGIVIYTGRIASLKRFKDDAKEVAQGFECGIGVENYNDIKVGDILEAFVIEEIAATLN